MTLLTPTERGGDAPLSVSLGNALSVGKCEVCPTKSFEPKVALLAEQPGRSGRWGDGR